MLDDKENGTSRNAFPENGAGKERRKKLSERIDDWNISDDVLDNVINILVAAMVFCAIASVSMLTLTFSEHILSMFILPLMVYIALGTPGVKLRMREKPSSLVVPDLICIMMVVCICLYLDGLFYHRDSDIYGMVIFGFVGIFGFLGFVSRWKGFFYLGAPFAAVYGVFLGNYYGLSVNEIALVVFLMSLMFLPSIWDHQFYFGMGRVLDKDGKVHRVTLEEQKVIQAQIKAEKKAAHEHRKRAAAKSKSVIAENEKEADKQS